MRELQFLERMSVSLLTQHRVEAPYGGEGGQAGMPGRQRLVRAYGAEIELKPVDGCEVGPGDRLILETPGGGGWGEETLSAGVAAAPRKEPAPRSSKD